MSMEVLGALVLWLFLFGYIFLGAVEFGAGFYNAYGKMTGREKLLERVIQRYLSPVWEVTNVFLVFFFVGIVGFFPDTAYYYGTTLLVPVSLALILLAVRGAYYAFATYGLNHPGFTYIYGLTGLLLPASLSIVLVISTGGFVEVGGSGPVLLYWELFTSIPGWLVVLLSLASVLYISAVFLTWYASYTKDKEAEHLLRKYALVSAFPAILTGVGYLATLGWYNRDFVTELAGYWWIFLLSFFFFLGTVYLIWKRRGYGLAVGFSALQYFFAFMGYGLAHYPYLLYPHLTLHDSFTNQAMAVSLIVAFVLGLFLLIPSLYLLLRLFLFDKEYVAGRRLNKA